MTYNLNETTIRIAKQCRGWYVLHIYTKDENGDKTYKRANGSNKVKIHQMIRETYNGGKNIKSSQISR